MPLPRSSSVRRLKPIGWLGPIWLLEVGCATGSVPRESPSQIDDASPRGADPAAGHLHSLVPADAHAVLFLNYAAIRAAGGLEMLAHSAAAADGRAARGFSEEHDVDVALQVALGPDNFNLFEGRFALSAIETARIGRSGPTHYRDRALWEDGRDALGQLSATRLVFGAPAAVRAVIDCVSAHCDPLAETAWFGATNRVLNSDGQIPSPVFLDLRALMTEELRARVPSEYAELGGLRWFALRVAGEADLILHAAGEAVHGDRARGIAAWAEQMLMALAETPTMIQLGFAPLLARTRVEFGRLGGIDNVVSWRLRLSPDERAMVMKRIDNLFRAARRADAANTSSGEERAP